MINDQLFKLSIKRTKTIFRLVKQMIVEVAKEIRITLLDILPLIEFILLENVFPLSCEKSMYNKKMKITKVTFIIPIYKVDKYREDIISSISQLKNSPKAEFIFVNNDTSKVINRKTENLMTWNNITFINNKENIGLLMSRWTGIQNISNDSDGFMFLDGDDYFQDITQIFNHNRNQILNFGYNEIYKNKSIYIKPDGCTTKYKLNNQIWGMYFPIEILENTSESFANDKLYDDFAIKELISLKWTINKIDSPIVNYRMRKTSISKLALSSNFARKQIYSRIKLFDMTKEKRYLKDGIFDLQAFKNSFDKREYREWKIKLVNRGIKKREISGALYRILKINTLLFIFRNIRNKS